MLHFHTPGFGKSAMELQRAGLRRCDNDGRPLLSHDGQSVLFKDGVCVIKGENRDNFRQDRRAGRGLTISLREINTNRREFERLIAKNFHINGLDKSNAGGKNCEINGRRLVFVEWRVD
jgi:hypothetical protein